MTDQLSRRRAVFIEDSSAEDDDENDPRFAPIQAQASTPMFSNTTFASIVIGFGAFLFVVITAVALIVVIGRNRGGGVEPPGDDLTCSGFVDFTLDQQGDEAVACARGITGLCNINRRCQPLPFIRPFLRAEALTVDDLQDTGSCVDICEEPQSGFETPCRCFEDQKAETCIRDVDNVEDPQNAGQSLGPVAFSCLPRPRCGRPGLGTFTAEEKLSCAPGAVGNRVTGICLSNGSCRIDVHFDEGTVDDAESIDFPIPGGCVFNQPCQVVGAFCIQRVLAPGRDPEAQDAIYGCFLQ